MVSVTLWIVLAFALGLIARHVGLPPLVGYLVAGFGLSAYGLETDPVLDHVAHAGVLLLLFSVGLKLRLSSLIRAEVLAGSVLHMALIGLFMAALFHFAVGLSIETAFMLAVALSFSSTVVAAKILEGKKELRAFHGRTAIGILIMQDLIAVAFLSFAGGEAPSVWALALLLIPLLRPLIHRLLELSGHDELLVLYGLVLALVVGGSSFEHVGLSSELGALLLGVLLSDHKRASEMSNALWSLKEVFLVGFLLQIGMSGHPTLEILGYAFLLCLLLPLKALLFFFILMRFKLRARTSFLTGLSLATFSEFGLIVAYLGLKNAWLEPQMMVMLAITVAISFALAAPLNRYAHDLYGRWEKRLQPFESEQRHPDDEPLHLGNSHLLIMGMGRVGTGAYDFLSHRKQRVIGLDSDTGKVELHRKAGRRVLYADAEDPGLWQNLDLSGIHAVLLAMPDLEANTIATKQLRRSGYEGFVSATAVFAEDLEKIKNAGADAAYNFYDEVGVGFAEHVWEQLFPDKDSAGVTDKQ
ncbi:MAG: cation:proton antiporter [Halobacteria archaeon]|nr:cation:proton antiporter [Halobacteria archaeon]